MGDRKTTYHGPVIRISQETEELLKAEKAAGAGSYDQAIKEALLKKRHSDFGF